VADCFSDDAWLLCSNPVATIDRTETTGNPQAPAAASFSSPGPNLITPGILKVREDKVQQHLQQ
jgi:hypothetical protein